MNGIPHNELQTILVIEDELPILQAIKTKLLKNGFNVVTCRDVQSAFQLIGNQPEIDLIWLDHYLIGNETGLDFIVKIKQDPVKKHIPVFIVSVSSDERTSAQYLHLGAEKFYTKSNHGLQEIINDIHAFFNNK